MDTNKKKKITLNELGEMMMHIVKHMATKEDIAEIREEMATKVELAEVRKEMATKAELAEVKNTMATASELGIVRRDVEALKGESESHGGFAKEIDHVLSRVVVIERHVGVTPSQDY